MTEPIDVYLQAQLAALQTPADGPQPTPPDYLPFSREQFLGLFEAQVRSRQVDLAARWLQARGAGHYTIGSAGHEGNAAVAAALRPSDPALLHYRSGGFYLARAAQVPGSDGVRDILLGLMAATADPISGGRHKVFGNAALNVIPQTSTIGSHLPRAVGVAFAIERARKLGVTTPWPADALTVASFGDASANHSTVVGALNAAAYCTFQGLPLPLLLLCEDNGIGISVPTPSGWLGHALSGRAPIRYERADGSDVIETFRVASGLADWVRDTRRPAILHLRTVRFMGHAGSDAELAYRTQREIDADYERDPLLHTAKALVATGVLSAVQVVEVYDRVGREVRATAEGLLGAPKLSSAAQVMAPIFAGDPLAVRREAQTAAPESARLEVFDGKLPEKQGPLTLAQTINAALTDVFAAHADTTLFGEDVGVKGGVYGVTRGLAKRFGVARVFDTLLDEQTSLGIALGSAVAGLNPFPEIQYLAYLHNAEDQLRGEAATLAFFSNGQYHNGMVVRVAGLAYQRGFGGHFHNDNGVAVLRDIPGLVVAVPAHPADAAPLLRTCAALARVDGRVCMFLEPIARYHTRDLIDADDDQWLAAYHAPGEWPGDYAELGRGRVHGDGDQLTLITFGNGLHMSRRVAATLAGDGIGVRILDLRWISPLPVDDIVEQANQTGRVLIVDETRRSGGVSEAVTTALVDSGYRGAIRRVTSEDSFIPLGDATQHVLLGEAQIEAAARVLVS